MPRNTSEANQCKESSAGCTHENKKLDTAGNWAATMVRRGSAPNLRSGPKNSRSSLLASVLLILLRVTSRSICMNT